MAHSTTIPGVPGGPVVTSFPVYLKIAPEWRTNVRPGIKARAPRMPVQHETANPNSLAVHDATYLQNGSEGRQASWHMTVDDKEAYIGIPLDEVTWQASDGSGPGNYRGISCELSVQRDLINNNARRAQSQKNAAELMGTIGARLSATPPAKRHHDYAPDKKWCPAQMMNRGEWNRYVDWWMEFYNAERARMSGQKPVESEFKVGDTFEIVADNVNVRSGSGTKYRIVGTLTKGRTGTVISDGTRHTANADGYTWLNVSIPGFGTGWMATGTTGEAWVEKTTIPAPAPKPTPQPSKPTYAKVSPVPELLQTNFTFEQKYNTAEGITTINELEFIFVADVIEFKRQSPALQFGDDSAKEVKPPYSEGERVIAAWLVKGKNGVWYYLLTGEDDEWVRVKYADTIRVSDAPLLGDDMH